MSELDEFANRTAQVTILLADSAQVADGKLYILGGGLNAIGPHPQPLAIAILIEVPWDRANISHDWKIELLDADGMPVMAGDMPVLVGGEFESGRPAGAEPGSPLPVPLAINISALPVDAGRSYAWRLAINGTSEPTWSVRFRVREA